MAFGVVQLSHVWCVLVVQRSSGLTSYSAGPGTMVQPVGLGAQGQGEALACHKPLSFPQRVAEMCLVGCVVRAVLTIYIIIPVHDDERTNDVRIHE
jgi:hypothetical protein